MASVPLTLDHMPEVPEPRANPNAHFLAGDVPHSTGENGRIGRGLLASVLSHAGGVLLFFFLATYLPPPTPDVAPRDVLPPDIIWVNSPGPGGGGGGGGNKSPDPPRKVELPGREKITVPVAKPPTLAPEPPKDVPKPDTQINIPAVTTSAGVMEIPGALTGLPTVPSQGSGAG